MNTVAFDQALNLMKDGVAVHRKGWGSIEKIYFNKQQQLLCVIKGKTLREPHLSAEDLLAEDWEVVN
jgi:hypothetical protein